MSGQLFAPYFAGGKGPTPIGGQPEILKGIGGPALLGSQPVQTKENGLGNPQIGQSLLLTTPAVQSSIINTPISLVPQLSNQGISLNLSSQVNQMGGPSFSSYGQMSPMIQPVSQSGYPSGLTQPTAIQPTAIQPTAIQPTFLPQVYSGAQNFPRIGMNSPSSLVIPLQNLSISQGPGMLSTGTVPLTPQPISLSRPVLGVQQMPFATTPISLQTPLNLTPVPLTLTPSLVFPSPINLPPTPLTLTPVRMTGSLIQGKIPSGSDKLQALPLNLRKRGTVLIPDPQTPTEYTVLEPIVLQPITDAPEEDIEVLQLMADSADNKIEMKPEILSRRELTEQILRRASIMRVTDFFINSAQITERFRSIPFAKAVRHKELDGLEYNYVPENLFQNPDLEQITKNLEGIFHTRISKVQAILLETGTQHLAWQMFPNDVHIYIATFGSTRKYKLKSSKDKTVKNFDLTSGDLFYLIPEVNRTHAIAIAGTKQVKAPHIAIIFYGDAPYSNDGGGILSPNTLRGLEHAVGEIDLTQIGKPEQILQRIRGAIN